MGRRSQSLSTSPYIVQPPLSNVLLKHCNLRLIDVATRPSLVIRASLRASVSQPRSESLSGQLPVQAYFISTDG